MIYLFNYFKVDYGILFFVIRGILSDLDEIDLIKMFNMINICGDFVYVFYVFIILINWLIK